MRLVWTKSNLPLSRIIRFISGDDCSHFAVHFNQIGLVLHSNLIGVHVSIDSDFFAGSLLPVHVVVVETVAEAESEACMLMLRKIAGKDYAYKALLYFGWRELLFKLFKVKLPEANAFASSRQFLCTQVYDVIPDNIIPTFPQLEDKGMISPHDLWTSVNLAHPAVGETLLP